MKYFTKNGREISFYGAGVKPEIDALFGVLLKSWVKRDEYSDNGEAGYDFDNNPAYGQCSVTALIVQDYLGGEIYRVRIGDGTHYFNKIDGQFFDLTSDQFSCRGIDILYEPNEKMSRDYCLSNKNTKMRYETLKENVERNLESLSGSN